MLQKAILAIDEGTTNSKAVLVSETGKILARASVPVPIQHPQSGWVQQDAVEIWNATTQAITACLKSMPEAKIIALGISNQRESVLIWDRKTGEPLGPVITWQCRRTATACEALRVSGHEPEVIARTGLPLDPLFPPTKITWLLDNHGRSANDICIGTIDSWLIWKLSGHQVHATDRSNAARTQLFNLAENRWDENLCELFNVNLSMLPEVQDSSHIFGRTKDVGIIADGIPIASAIGDSHGALFGHGAFDLGDGKVTFGTGSSVMAIIPEFIAPPTGITTTIAWSLNGQTTYAFEGNILVSASILPWTAALLGFSEVDDLLTLAQTVDDTGGVSLVPAHVGLGAPHWQAEARGLISGLSFNSGPAQIARAAAESMAFQVNDVFSIMTESTGDIGRLFVDGGPSHNRYLMQLVSDYLNHPVILRESTEASAIGAAHLAGLAIGFWPDLDAVGRLTRNDIQLINPSMSLEQRDSNLATWRIAIARTVADV